MPMGVADPWAERDPWAGWRSKPSQQHSGGNGVSLSEKPGGAWSNYQSVSSSVKSHSRGGGDHHRNDRRRCQHQLPYIEWDGELIVPVRKHFYCEHPDIVARTEEECDAIRCANGIAIVNESRCDVPKPIRNFGEAAFPDWAAQEMALNNFEAPMPIQMQAWPIALAGHDLVGIAETGSGKTMAYVMPMLVHIQAQPELKPGEGPIGLVILPVRELCQQVSQQVKAFTTYTGITCMPLHGGDVQGECGAVQRSPIEKIDVFIATPGRLITLLNWNATNLRRVTFVVLDEADLLLSDGFEDQITMLMSQVRPDRQCLLFSATWPTSVEQLATKVCHQDPIHINIGSLRLSACKAIKQRFMLMKEGGDAEKIEALSRALNDKTDEMIAGSKVLIFCNAREKVPLVVDSLKSLGFPVDGVHGNQTQRNRDEVLLCFAVTNQIPILVATQILGRGHDFQNLHYVINYDMPRSMVEYIHRIGRTGRANKTGWSLTLLEESDLYYARELVNVIKESGQGEHLPKWLAEAAQRRRGKKPARSSCSAASVPVMAETSRGGAAELPWRGRGTGERLKAFLSQSAWSRQVHSFLEK